LRIRVKRVIGVGAMRGLGELQARKIERMNARHAEWTAVV
jgi:hypothetical protein